MGQDVECRPDVSTPLFVRLIFHNVTAPADIYALSLHDALPILADGRAVVTNIENPQHQPLPLHVGGELPPHRLWRDRKSTRLNSSHVAISYAVFCLKKKKNHTLSSLECKHTK